MEGKFKVWIIIAILVLAVAVVGSAFIVTKTMNKVQETGTEEKEDIVALKEVELGEAIMTNIAMEDDQLQHFAKIQISVGIAESDEKQDKVLMDKMATKSANIRHELIQAIGAQTFTVLSNTTTGKEKLSDEIIVRLNTLLETDQIKAVYYKEYFVQ